VVIKLQSTLLCYIKTLITALMFRPIWPSSGAFLSVTDVYSMQHMLVFKLHHGSKMTLHRKMSCMQLKFKTVQ
jgi:hypothetical protein